MKLRYLFLSLIAGLGGCSTPDFHAEHYSNRFKQYGYGFTPEHSETKHTNDKKLNPKILKKYSDRIVYELSQQVDKQSLPIVAVASFVDLDDNLVNTHPLGNKLAEDILISLQEAGFRATDLYVATKMSITAQGSFVFSRNTSGEVQVPFVVSGIINYTPNGANINARLVATATGTILAAYTLSIPNFVINNAFPTVEGQDLLIKNS